MALEKMENGDDYEQEMKKLQRLYDDGRAELIVVYGKADIANETFDGGFVFRHTGLPLGKEQLEYFYHSLLHSGIEETERPENWMDAFFLLAKFLQERDTGQRQAVFLEEKPRLDIFGLKFIHDLEAFWNSWGCHRKNLMVIVSGSDISWLYDHLVNNCGGMYGRVTHVIDLCSVSG